MEIPPVVGFILVVGGLTAAVLVFLACLRIFSIDESLKAILAELRKRNL